MLLYSSLIQRLATQHEAIEKIIAGVDHDQLLMQPQPGKWSIKDQVAHIARYQLVFIERVKLIMKDDKPVFERYSAEEDPEFATWQSWDMPTLINRLYADRKLIYELVTTSSCTQSTMTGIHKKFGELTLVQWTEFFLLHEAHHLFAIFQLANSNTSK